jgi:hypothetical protein
MREKNLFSQFCLLSVACIDQKSLEIYDRCRLLIELLQEMQEIFIINRLADDRVQAIDSLIVGGVVKRNTALA